VGPRSASIRGLKERKAMGVYELIMKRRSVRNFEDKEIPEDVIGQLLDAANNAPSGGNIQPISVIVVQKAEARDKLAKMVGDQPWVKNAPLSMIFCIDFFRIKTWASMFDTDYTGEKALLSFLIAYADLMCSAQNVVILAQSRGLGSVYIGTILDVIDKARECFSIPKYVLPMMVLSIGYPRTIPKNIPKLKREIIAHRESYRTMSDHEIKQAFEEKYGSFDDNLKKHFEKIYVEALEAEKQEKPEWADPEKVKAKLKKLGIKSNAEFMFKFRYPSKMMIRMNRNLKAAFEWLEGI
jgi:nitroreductase